MSSPAPTVAGAYRWPSFGDETAQAEEQHGETTVRTGVRCRVRHVRIGRRRRRRRARAGE